MNAPTADRYALIGRPVAHSVSPAIHARFAAQTGEAVAYELLEAPRDGFAAAVARFVAEGGRGLNVTLPFKEEAHRLADTASARARAAGAVNTLAIRAGGGIYGDNTDGAGLLRDLRANCGLETKGRDVLVLGAGGAARGIIPPLLESGVASLVIANRSVERARALERRFASAGIVTACAFSALAGRRFDGVVNATSASLAGEVPALPESVATEWGYDLAYAKLGATAFVRWLQRRGVRCAFDGLGMLVEQAAESFFLWRGVRPQTAPVIRELRSPHPNPLPEGEGE